MSIFFDTDNIAARERAEFWQEVVCNTFVPLSCAFSDRNNFQGRLRSHSIATLSLVDVQASLFAMPREFLAATMNLYW